MPFDYPEEIREQQAIVKRELKKLARMRTEYLIATGQMPPSANKNMPASSDKSGVAASPSSGHPEVTAS
ncbi:MAG: hypothetical protein OXG39_02045 [Chloroflexi bacterium]|nr:hypothetical protein [Chloroflexota bacterium]